MYFIHVQFDGKGRHELLSSNGTTTNRYMYAIFFRSREEAEERVSKLKEWNPQHNFKITKK